MFNLISLEIENSARNVFLSLTRELLSEMEVQGWNWGYNNDYVVNADGNTVYVQVEIDACGELAYTIESPDMHLKAVTVPTINKAISTLALLW